MTKILFVCHGNICRSPMAAAIFTEIARKRGKSAEFAMDSAAVSAEELGNPMYPPARRKLREKGVPILPHAARRMTATDYEDFDLLIGMEARHLSAMRRITGGDPEGKIHRLLDFTTRSRDVEDPWYTDDFETAYRDIAEGCEALLEALIL